MSHLIQRQIQAIARRARRLLLVHGLCWFVVVVVSVAFVFGWLDYALRLRDQGVRLILSAAFGLTLLWSLRRFIVPSMRRHFGDLEVARQVERRFPQLGDRLSSSLEFLRREDSTDQSESATLRQTVICETESLVRPLKLDDCLDPRATRRSLLACFPLLIAVGFVSAIDFEATSLAARRLVAPWSRESWPRWNDLEFIEPHSRIALGHDFAVEVADRRGRLPDEAKLLFWFEGDEADEVETVTMQRGEDRFHYTRGNVTRSFQYRAIGGDDDSMAWHSLEVVEPARITELHITVQPPEYSGIRPAELSAGPLRVLAGSRLAITGRTTRPVQEVRFHADISDQNEVFKADIAVHDSTFSIDSLPTDTPGKGQYWIELTEADGVVSGSDTRASWEVVPDHAPTVTVSAPTNEMYFTPTATVPIRVTATDDLALQRVELRIGTTTIPLFVGAEQPAGRDDLPAHADIREITRELDLGEFQLAPHDLLELEFIAYDYLPQASDVVTRSLTFISREDFDYRSQEKQKLLLVRLAEALRLQRATRSQVTSLQTQLDTVGTLSDEDANLLRASELQQQQVARLLDDRTGGAAQVVAELIASLSSNDMAESEAAARMERLATMLDLINRERMPDLQSELLRAAKSARISNNESGAVAELLNSAGRRQDSIAADLQSMIDQLARWDDYRRFAQDVATLLRDQQSLSAQVSQLPTIGQRLDALSPQERSDLERASGQQLELAQRLDRLQAEMDRLRETLRQSDSSAAATLAEATREARANGIAERMREVGEDVARNRLGNAAQTQSRVEQDLQQVLSALTESSRAGSEEAEQASSQELAAALTQLKTQLADVTSRQQVLLDETIAWQGTGSASLTPAQMAREQTQLVADLTKLREQKPIPKAFAFGMQSVEEIMDEAADRLASGPPDDGVERQQRHALSRLQQLLAALDTQPTRENSSNAGDESAASSSNDQRPAFSMEELRLLHAMQLAIYERTVALENKRQASGTWDDESQEELQQLASEQGKLAELLMDAMPPEDTRADSQPSAPPSELDRDLDRVLDKAGIPGFGADR